ncbi:hypothetical protein J6590_010752 [Homalodisca vitripennis]|nr:hypothetical protein J6590_010752 [Homalodisca vitripennis]
MPSVKASVAFWRKKKHIPRDSPQIQAQIKVRGRDHFSLITTGRNEAEVTQRCTDHSSGAAHFCRLEWEVTKLLIAPTPVRGYSKVSFHVIVIARSPNRFRSHQFPTEVSRYFPYSLLGAGGTLLFTKHRLHK